MERYYYANKILKVAFVFDEAPIEIPEGYEFLGSTTNPSAKMALSAFIPEGFGYTINYDKG
jgi:hypothetical protein